MLADPKFEIGRLPHWRRRTLFALAAASLLAVAGLAAIAQADSGRVLLRGGLPGNSVVPLAIAAPEGVREAPALVALPAPPVTAAAPAPLPAVDPLAPTTTETPNPPSTVGTTTTSAATAPAPTSPPLPAPVPTQPPTTQVVPLTSPPPPPPPPPTTQPPPPTTQAPPPTVSAVRSFSFAGGSITAEVTGGSVRVLSVSAVRGYESEVQSRGSSQYVRLVGGNKWQGILVSVGGDGGPTASVIAGSD